MKAKVGPDDQLAVENTGFVPGCRRNRGSRRKLDAAAAEKETGFRPVGAHENGASGSPVLS